MFPTPGAATMESLPEGEGLPATMPEQNVTIAVHATCKVTGPSRPEVSGASLFFHNWQLVKVKRVSQTESKHEISFRCRGPFAQRASPALGLSFLKKEV